MNSLIRKIVSDRNFVILDTETTGLKKPSEPCSIAIVDHRGETLLDTLIRPSHPIPYDAQHIHGISDLDVELSPTWPDIKPTILDLIRAKDVLVYNAKYDRHMMHNADENWSLGDTNYHAIATWTCVMEAYAEFHGEENVYYGGYKWQKLSVACQQMRLDVIDAHNALGDCKMTYALLRCTTGDLEAWKVTDFETGR